MLRASREQSENKSTHNQNRNDICTRVSAASLNSSLRVKDGLLEHSPYALLGSSREAPINTRLRDAAHRQRPGSVRCSAHVDSVVWLGDRGGGRVVRGDVLVVNARVVDGEGGGEAGRALRPRRRRYDARHPAAPAPLEAVAERYCPLEVGGLDGGAGEDAEALRQFFKVKLAVDVAVCFLVLAGNALTISALLHQRWCRKETLCPRFKVSSLFVMNLAVADFLIGCSMLFFLVSHYVCSISEYMTQHRFLCVTKTATFMFSGIISVCTLGAISIDRYVAVIHSLRYQEYMTRRRACGIISLTWVVGLVSASSLFLWNHFEAGKPCLDTVIPKRLMVFLVAPLHVLVLSVILVAHIRIRQEIKRMRARRKEHEKSIWGAQVQRGSIKSMRAVVLVIGCYVVCYVPFTCVLGARLMGVRSPGMDMAFQILCTVINLNPMLNPFIYSWKNASVRTALRQFFDKVALLTGVSAPRDPRDGKKVISTTLTASSLTASSLSATLSHSGQGRQGPGQGPAVISGKQVPERYVPYENVI
ncbi:lysophosphatidic acid receptor 3-like [Thrips palmi]|uniref:Lysophosphatidic acid receptor 3-like n=1 Tax=Thrips palmi TaxID=161013 RepID=A0A6P9A739_THRPL|nr:lysophosphatidic acid receptor 3-like [Thrips palmi]